MNQGAPISYEGSLLIDKISIQLRQYNISSNTDTAVITDMITVIRNLYDARENRILASNSSLSSAIWVVILLGTGLSLCISYLFGVNFYLHIFSVIASALMMSAIIFLLISLDKPFLGSYAIGPEAYQTITTLIDR
jgi:hypothetical protein